MKLYAYLAAALALVAAGFAGGWNVRAWKADHDNADRLKIEVAQQQANTFKADASSVHYETAKATREATGRVITREIIRVVEADPVYRTECVSDDGLRLVARALGVSPAASESGPAVRATTAPD